MGVAEDMCGRTTGNGGRSKNQEWWSDEVARAVDEKREVWKKIETIKDRGEQPSVAMKHLYVMDVRRKPRDEQLTKPDRKWKRNSTKSWMKMVARE